jgi:hypothetical protein
VSLYSGRGKEEEEEEIVLGCTSPFFPSLLGRGLTERETMNSLFLPPLFNPGYPRSHLPFPDVPPDSRVTACE